MIVTPIMSDEALSEVFATVEATLVDSRRLVREGRMVDLKPLGAQVEAACQGVVALGRADAQPYLPRLEHIISSLDGLEQELRRQYAALQTGEGAGCPPARAARAYAAPEAVPPAAPAADGASVPKTDEG